MGAATEIEAVLASQATACPHCPVCHSGQWRSTPYRRDPYAVVRCADCSLWYLSPRLPEHAIEDLYRRDDYFAGDSVSGYGDYASQEPSLRVTFRRLLRHLETRGIAGGALLEVGCGFGYFLDEARPFFEHRVGTEMSPHAASCAEVRADRLVRGGVAELDDEARFDCIVALQVIEHIYDPVPFVRELAGRLRPGGAVVLSTPHMGSLWRQLLGRRWPSFKFPEHVVFYDDVTLPDLLKRAGLQGIGSLPHPHAFPMAEVLAKLGLSGALGRGERAIWIPGTTIACVGYGASEPTGS